jgi:hypothetical protein
MDHPQASDWYLGGWSVGLRWATPRALPLPDEPSLCQDTALASYLPRMAPALGAAYTLAGCVTDAVRLLTQAMEQSTPMEMVHFEMLCRLSLGEAHLLAGRLEEAYILAEHVLALACTHKERGNEAYALHLLGEIAAQREPGVRRPHSTTARPGSPRNSACARSWPCHRGSAHCMPRLASRSSSRRAVRGHRAVPCHGHDVLAGPDGSDAGAGGGTVRAYGHACNVSRTVVFWGSDWVALPLPWLV